MPFNKRYSCSEQSMPDSKRVKIEKLTFQGQCETMTANPLRLSNNGCWFAVERLLESGTPDVSQTDWRGSTLLHHAAEQGNFQAVRMLVGTATAAKNRTLVYSRQWWTLEIDVNSQDHWGRTALLVSVLCGHEMVFRTLLKHGGVDADIYDDFDMSAILYVIMMNQTFRCSIEVSRIDILLYDANMTGWLTNGLTSAQQHRMFNRLLDHNVNIHGVKDSSGDLVIAPIHAAASCGNAYVIEKLLKVETFRRFADKKCKKRIKRKKRKKLDKRKKCINAMNKGGFTALMLAVAEGNANIARQLLKHGANANFGSQPEGCTTLHIAAEYSYIDVVNVLLDSKNGCDALPIDLEARNENGETALLIATRTGHRDIIMALLEHGASTAITNTLGLDFLQYAQIHCSFEFFDWLAEKYESKDGTTSQFESRFSAIMYDGRQWFSVELCCLNDCEINTGDADATQLQFWNSGNLTRAMLAHDDSAEALEEPINAEKQTETLRLVLRLQTRPVLRSVLRIRKPSSNRSSAVRNPSVESLSNFAKQHRLSLNINAQNETGSTILMDAAYMGSLSAVKTLLELGADAAACNEEGFTALHDAIIGIREEENLQLVEDINPFDNETIHERLQIVDELLATGLNVNSPNFDGNTVLHFATNVTEEVGCKADAILRYLMSEGCDVNARDKTGKTPLHRAIQSGSLENAKFLLEAGADPTLTDAQLTSSLDRVICTHCLESLQTASHSDSFKCMTLSRNMVITSVQRVHNVYDIQHQTPNAVLEHWYRLASDRTLQKRIVHFANCPLSQTDDPVQILQHWAGSTNVCEKRGRGFLHLLFLVLNTYPEQLDKTSDGFNLNRSQMRNFTRNIREAAGIVDHFGRSALHYATMLFPVSNCILSSDDFIDLYRRIAQVSDLNRRDRFGRTPLHYAALHERHQEAYELLLQYEPDVTISDIAGETPQQLFQPEDKGDNISALFDRSLNELLMNKIFDLDTPIPFESHGKLETVTCSHASPACETFNGAISQAFYDNPATGKLCNIYTWVWNSQPYAQRIHDTAMKSLQVDAFINRLVKAIERADPRLEATVKTVGSSYEGTRIGRADEYDYNAMLTRFSTICGVSTSPGCPAGYLLLKRNATKNGSHTVDEFFDDFGYLSTTLLRLQFEHVAKEVLRNPEFWKDENFFELNLKYDCELYSSHSDRVCMTLQLKMNTSEKSAIRSIDGNRISIDVVPCIHISGHWPEDSTQDVSQRARDTSCTIVFALPHKLYPWVPVRKSFVRVSFAQTESAIIRGCSAVTKAAFMVAKHLVSAMERYNGDHVTDSSSHFSPYALKMALLYTVASSARDKTRRASRNRIEETELRRFMRNVLYALLRFDQQGYVPSFFQPSNCVPTLNNESFLRRHAVHMHAWRASIVGGDARVRDVIRRTFEELCDQQSSEFIFRERIKAFQVVHALYWLACEEGSLAPIVDFTTNVNPLVENINASRCLVRDINSF